MNLINLFKLNDYSLIEITMFIKISKSIKKIINSSQSTQSMFVNNQVTEPHQTKMMH